MFSEQFPNMLHAFEPLRAEVSIGERAELKHLCVAISSNGWEAVGAISNWNVRIVDLTRRYFREELTPAVLELHEEGATNWALFSCFAVGWLLALEAEKQIDRTQADILFAQLPGFMWLEEGAICHFRTHPSDGRGLTRS